MKKRIFSLTVVLFMLFSLFACDLKKDPVDEPEDSLSVQESNGEDSSDEKIESSVNDAENSKGEESSFTDGSNENSEVNSEVNSEESIEGDGSDYTPDKVEIKAYLAELIGGYFVNPYSFIPESMLPYYESRLVDADSINTDYSDFVQVSDIGKMGMGEQWNMISENLAQSQMLFIILGEVDTVITSSVVVFNNYIDSNPAATAEYSFVEGIYTVTVKCDSDTVYYVLDYEREVPALGEQAIQIAMSMDLDNKEKTVRIQLSDLYALSYTVKENSYSFAIRYGYKGKIGEYSGLIVRSAYFEAVRNEDDTVEGRIYEYITAGAENLYVDLSSSAEFYVSDKYVTAIGNKADDMIAFKGYICELYDAESGEMIAYEVKETLSAIEYNTIWLNLRDVSGISSVKYVPETSDNDAMLFVNGMSDPWETKNVGFSGGVKFASRRFDIEFRKQYFYYYDAEEETYVSVGMDVPMLFVQEECYDDLIKDVKETNGIDISVCVGSGDLQKLLKDYDELVPVFAEGENSVSPSDIAEIIGERIIFD